MSKSSAQFYFEHEAMYTAILNGWDFEQDLDEFFKTLSEVEMNKSIYSLKSSGKSVSTDDYFKASRGEITEGMKEFLKGVNEVWSVKGINKDAFVMSSMHSGSSAYLTKGGLEDILGGIAE